MRALLDASIDAATLKKIEDAIEANPEVSAVEEVMSRNSGRYLRRGEGGLKDNRPGESAPSEPEDQARH